MKTKLLLLASLATLTLSSCDDDDDDEVVATTATETVADETVKFIVAANDPATDLSSGVYMRLFSNIDSTYATQSVFGNNEKTTYSYDSFTQFVYNPTSGVYTGFIYANGASEYGIGAKTPGLRTYKVENDSIVELDNSPVKVENFGNTGYYGTYSYGAQISNPYVMRVDDTGAGTNLAVALPSYAIDETNPTIQNIIDRGNNEVAMVLYYSNTDSAAVAFCDYDLNIQSVIYDSRIGGSIGQMRSNRYPMSAADADGNIYVFCGSSEDESKVGALRINKGSYQFDSSYQFDIFSASDGYRFRKAFFIGGSKFLLEFYLSKTDYANMSASGLLAVVDMQSKSFTWVSGLPDLSVYSVGYGDGNASGSYYYLPVAAGTTMSGSSDDAAATFQPAIYRINTSTGVAEAWMSFSSNDLLKSIRILK